MARVEISNTLLDNCCVLEDILNDATHSGEEVHLTTDSAGTSSDHATFNTQLTAQTLDIVLDINGNTLTFTAVVDGDVTTPPNGIAESLYDIAELMRAGAEVIRDIARTKYP